MKKNDYTLFTTLYQDFHIKFKCNNDNTANDNILKK